MKRILYACVLLCLSLWLGLGSQVAMAAGRESAPGAEAPALLESETPAPGNGIIQVEVINQSGGDLPIGANVILYGYEQEQVVFEKSHSLPQDGVVVFEDVPMPAGRVYVAATQYRGVRYGSTLAEITADTTQEASIEIAVFDTTTDLSVLAIDQLHIFVEFVPNSTQVIALMLLSNPSDQTVVAENEGDPVIELELPQNAINLQVQESMQLRYMQTEGGFGVTNLRPSDGPYEITFGFELPNQGDRVSLKMPVPLDTGSAIVFLPGDAAQLESDQFQRAEDLDMQGTTYNTYSTNDLKAGDSLSFSLDDITEVEPSVSPSEETSPSYTAAQIGLVALGMILIAVGVFFWWRNRQDSGSQPDKEKPASQSREAEELMDAIIALDDLYKVGEFSEKEYQARRAKLKERLRKAVEKQEDL